MIQHTGGHMPVAMEEYRKNAGKRPVLYAIAAGFLFSLTIETLQLMLRLGTFQLSDICYNTLGGMIGGVMFWIIRLIRKQ